MNEVTPNIAIVILAAGASRRMGSPKQLLKWGDDSLISHAIKTTLNIENSEVIVVLGANYQRIKKEISDYPVTILNNENWALGLGSSIACVSNYLLELEKSYDGILVTLADQPLITKGFLKTLVRDFSMNKRQINATSYKDGKLGVPALFDKEYFKELSNLDNDKGAGGVIKTYTKNTAVFDLQYENIDLDFKKDYEKLYKSVFNGS